MVKTRVVPEFARRRPLNLSLPPGEAITGLAAADLTVYPDAEIGAVVLSADALEIELVLSPASAIDTVMRMVGGCSACSGASPTAGRPSFFYAAGGDLENE
jgi:hypothetical protein